MPLYRDEGVVLRTAKLGEADRIVTLFTRGHGTVRAVAKGVRRTRSRFGSRLEPFMRVDVLVATGRSLDVISQAESLAAYAAPIVADVSSYEAASALAETAGALAGGDGEPAPAQYRLLVAALASLARRRHDPEATALSYVMRALSLAGWEPRLDVCVVCGRAADPSRGLYLSAPAGGLLCQADHTPESMRVGEDALSSLAALTVGDWRAAGPGSPPDEAVRFVRRWAEFFLERPLRSLRLLER